jgi:hypothetical protein
VSKKPTPQPHLPRPASGWHFSARLFAAVAPFRALSGIRYYLQGVYFCAHPERGAVIAATNGHQLAIAYDAEGAAPSSRIVPVTPAAVAAAAKAGRQGYGWVGVDETRLVVAERYAEAFIQPGATKVDGTYPDVFKVLPQDLARVKPAACGTFNATYIEDIGRIGKLLGREHNLGVSFWQVDRDSVMVARFDAEPNVIVATMPMHTSGYGKPLPIGLQAFYRTPKKAAPKRAAQEEATAP